LEADKPGFSKHWKKQGGEGPSLGKFDGKSSKAWKECGKFFRALDNLCNRR
jgi:hypothetical protein